MSDILNLYKVLNADQTSPFWGFKFKRNKWYHCEDFSESEKDCDCGFYATGIDGLAYAFTTFRDVYECQVKGKRKEFDQFKRRYEYFKLGRKMRKDEIIELAKSKEAEVGYKLSEALFPFDPREVSNELTQADIDNLDKWISALGSVRGSVLDSVWGSVWYSVWESVRGSVLDSVMDSVWDSVRGSVWGSVLDSVRGSVYAYIGSLFPNIKKWEYIDHPDGVYPFQPAVDLIHRGFVPSFDGKVWRLHSGKDMKVIYERGEK